MSPSEEILASLRTILPSLQATMRLQDWDISIELARNSFAPDRYGDCRYFRPKQARIRILDPQDWDDLAVPLSEEAILSTLIHEMLHLHFYRLLDEDNEHEVEEVIGQLERIIYKLIESNSGTEDRPSPSPGGKGTKKGRK